MGGRGVTIHIAVQSRAQLRQRWGDTGAAAILNNAATLLIFGGSRDNEDLAAYSTLTGERYEKVETWDKDGTLTGRDDPPRPGADAGSDLEPAALARPGRPPRDGAGDRDHRHDVGPPRREAGANARRPARRSGRCGAPSTTSPGPSSPSGPPRGSRSRRERLGDLALRLHAWAAARADDAGRNRRARAAARRDEPATESGR